MTSVTGLAISGKQARAGKWGIVHVMAQGKAQAVKLLETLCST